ncbi:MAG: alpha-L-rhamnosidase C-terminal domain-containing protein [Planctomycetia bacterium]|nr:alpha-L-rhamnosidase C-terminal domain-containing protein [Planctomycetia bacterium]
MKRYNVLSFLIFIIVLFSSTLFASNPTPIGKHYQKTSDFQAHWIRAADTPVPFLPNIWTAYRKTIELDAVPEKAICRIACDSKYWLYINGQNVVFEGELKRGPTPSDSYFDVVDIKPFLKEGQNCIAVLVWFFGKHGFSHVNSGQPGLLFDASTNGDNGLKLLSDSSWKATIYSAVPQGITAPNITERNNKETPTAFDISQVDPNWRTKTSGAYEMITIDPQPNRRLAEWNIRFNAQYDFQGDWKAVDFDDSAWKSATELGIPGDQPVAPWGNLFERPLPLFKDHGLFDYVNQAEIPQELTGDPIVCKLPYNCHATPYLKIDAPAGLTIDMRTDNYMGGSEYNVRAEYVTKEGIQEYESLGWMNGHQIIYSIPEGVKIIELKYRETGFNSEFAGYFNCDDPFYNELWKKAVRTLYVTMRDGYFDCPDRERSHWWGDAVNELGEAFYAMDRNADSIPRKGFYELIRFQRPDGTIYSPIPDGNWSKELPAQMLATISIAGLGTYSWFSGDFTTGQDIYPGIKKYLALWEFDEFGVIKVRHGDWSWGDWGENIDLRVLLNAWFALALEEAIDLATQLDLSDDVAAYQEQLDKLHQNFNQTFWTGKDYRDPNYKGRSDDRANALAVLAGFAKSEQYPILRQHFQNEKNASPYMEKYVLEALFRMGYGEDALFRLKERFGKMVNDQTYTTLWEGWGIGAEGYGGGTINHAWSGGGLTCLAQYAIGLNPTQPAFKEFLIAPQMGHLKKIDSKTKTHFGVIEIQLKQTENSFEAKVIVPEGIRGILAVPEEFARNNNSCSDSVFDEKFDAILKGRHFYELKSGTNQLKFKKSSR